MTKWNWALISLEHDEVIANVHDVEHSVDIPVPLGATIVTDFDSVLISIIAMATGPESEVAIIVPA